jgi:hypothetical protein
LVKNPSFLIITARSQAFGGGVFASRGAFRPKKLRREAWELVCEAYSRAREGVFARRDEVFVVREGRFVLREALHGAK